MFGSTHTCARSQHSGQLNNGFILMPLDVNKPGTGLSNISSDHFVRVVAEKGDKSVCYKHSGLSPFITTCTCMKRRTVVSFMGVKLSTFGIFEPRQISKPRNFIDGEPVGI